MAESVQDSRIVIPFKPTMLHMAVVSVASALFKSFELSTLDRAFAGIQRRNSRASSEGCQEISDVNCERAEKGLKLVPTLLRKEVLKTIHGMHYAVGNWRREHPNILRSKDGKCIFRWKPDGSVDAIKTAQELVLYEKIDIRKRFKIACKYCFEESVQSLWSKMEASGQTENFITSGKSMELFWVRRMRGVSHFPWKKEAAEYFKHPRMHPLAKYIRFSSFLPLLRPEKREEFLFIEKMGETERDDFLTCLYALTKEEQERILERYAASLLFFYLEMPFQSLFLETAEKLWQYIDHDAFHLLLLEILDLKSIGRKFDEYELLEGFWEKSPERLRKAVERYNPSLNKDIKSCLQKRKREADDDDRAHSKRKRLVQTQMGHCN